MTLKKSLEKHNVTDGCVISAGVSVSIEELSDIEFHGECCLPELAILIFENEALLVKALLALDSKIKNIALVSNFDALSRLESRVKNFESLVITDIAGVDQAIDLTTLAALYKEKEQFETRWLLSTSGTTSEPKLVPHTLASLLRATKVGTGYRHVWGCLYDPTRFAGLQVLLQSLFSGATIVFPNHGEDLGSKIEMFAAHGVNCISATPTYWRKILMTTSSDCLKLNVISLGGEIADDRILNSLSSRFPNAKIRHIYASTEAGTGFSISDKKSGFPTALLSDSSLEIQIKIQNGFLLIHNPLVGAKYVGSSDAIVDSSGFVNTGDKVIVDGDRVKFLGRESGVINVGGNKVYPENIERVLLMVPLVVFARVFSLKSPITGELVCCEIVLEHDADRKLAERELREHVKKYLNNHEWPIKYSFLNATMKTNNGKMTRS